MSCVYQNKNNLMIFTGGKFPQKELALKVLENLGFTKDSSFVISVDSGFSVATDYGFKTDLLIGDMDSIDKSLFSKIDDDICQKKFPKDKDFSDTELAFIEAKKIPHKNSVLIGGSGGSIEHFEAIISAFKFEKFTKKIMSLPKFWLTEENLIIFCKQGEEIKISCLEESDKISVFSANQNNHFAKICSEGLKWKLQNVNWKKQVSLSNRKSELTNKNSQNDTDVSIFAKRGNFLIILPLKDSIKVSNSCKKD